MKRGNIMNPFVGYLNTLHNASGSNEHAIAENKRILLAKNCFFIEIFQNSYLKS